MPRRLSIPKLTKRIPQLDAEFAGLLAQNASPALLSAFVVRNYLPVAYIFALRINRSHISGEDAQDEVSEMAVSAIDDVVEKIGAGRFSFRGDARFSTYLWSTLKRMRGDRRYVPKAVARLGQEARRLFQLHVVEGRDAAECRQLMRAETNLTDDAVDELLRRIHDALAGTAVTGRLAARRSSVELDPTDPSVQQKTIAPGDNPEDAFLKDVLKERVESVLADLPELDRTIVELRYIADVSIREIGRRLGLKSPQYRFEQARDRFLAEARARDLPGLYEAVMAKEDAHG